MKAALPRPPWRGLLVLWLGAVLLDLWGIQHGPLRDWDESLLARVALELSEKPWPDLLLPTFWGDPYLNKPPAAHWLVAALIRLWRGWAAPAAGTLPPEWLLRLGPALGSSLLGPLLGLVQWRLRPGRRADALWTAAMALTLLPLARHAHLAMLDGLQLTALASLWLGLLLAGPGLRRPLAPGVLAGLAGSLLLLLKAPVLLPVLLVSLGLRRWDGDLSRRQWRWLLLGMTVGLLPGIAWHLWHLAWRGDDALLMWGRQGLARVVNAVENHSGGPIPPLIQVLSGGWPWLLLWPAGIAQAWRQRSTGWGRWCLGLTALVTLMVMPLQTQLPWYSLLLWPPFALCCAPVMVALIEQRLPRSLRLGITRIWLVLAVLLLLVLPLSLRIPALVPAAAISGPGGLALFGAAVVLGGEEARMPWRRRAAWGLVVGWSLSLLLLFGSSLWNWELNQKPLIAPLLPLIAPASRGGALSGVPLLLEGEFPQRPSVRWYAAEALERAPGRRRAAALLLVSQAATPEASELARELGVDRINRRSCRLDRRGADGWQRWLCRLR